MDDVLTPRLLDDSMVERAYALVRNLAPGVTRARWRQFVMPSVRPGSSAWPRGLMSVQNAAGYILGLYRFEVRRSLYVRRILTVDNIIVADLPGRERIRATIIKTMENLASLYGCPLIRAEISNDFDLADGERNWILTAFEGSGFSVGGTYATKRLPRTFDPLRTLRS